MGAKSHIKTALKAKKKTAKEYSREHGEKYQTFRNKLNRDCMRFSEVERIADYLGCDVGLIDRETKEIY